MKIKTSYDKEIAKISINKLDLDSCNLVISELEEIKKTNIGFVIFEFNNAKIDYHPEKIEDRIEWSKIGQVIRNYIEQIPQYTIAYLKKGNFINEIFEMALFCKKIYANKNCTYNFNKYPMWGNLIKVINFSKKNLLNFEISLKKIIEDSVKIINDDRNIYKHIKKIKKIRNNFNLLEKNLENILSKENNNIDIVENVFYANRNFLNNFNKINYLKKNSITKKNISLYEKKDLIIKINTNRIESNRLLGEGHRNQNPIKRAKQYIEEEDWRIKNIIEQKKFPIEGKCIELGSGAGFLSMNLSKLKKVKKMHACEINTTQISWLTPTLNELVKPDWKKMEYIVTDYEEIENNKQYDVAIFAASLNCTSGKNVNLAFKKAFNILKPGGILLLYDEGIFHYFFNKKVKNRNKENKNFPYTIPEYFEKLKEVGFEPNVFRNVSPGKRFPKLKKIFLEKSPLKYLNGWFFFCEVDIFAIKPKN